MIRDTARDFARAELAPHAAALGGEAAGFPTRSSPRWASLGLLGMTVPPEWGGTGADYVAYVLAVEEIAAGCAATATLMSVQNGLGCGLVQAWGNDAQKKAWLPDLASGQDNRLLLPHRAPGRQRGQQPQDARHRVERRLGARGHEAVHLERASARSSPSCSRSPTRKRARRACRPSSCPPARPGFDVAEAREEAGPARRWTPAPSRSRAAAWAATPSWARAARGSPSRSPTWRAGASASRRRPWASPAPRSRRRSPTRRSARSSAGRSSSTSRSATCSPTCIRA